MTNLNAKLDLITPPAAEPVSLQDAKAWLRLETSADDAVVSALVTAARLECEKLASRSLITTGWRYTLDRFPGWGTAAYPAAWAARPLDYSGDAIRLPRPPLVSVESVSYRDAGGTWVDLDPSAYQVGTGSPGEVAPADGRSWPLAQARLGSVRVDYTAGYGDAAAVPQGVKTAILFLVSHWYENRAEAAEVPGAVAALLDQIAWGSYS